MMKSTKTNLSFLYLSFIIIVSFPFFSQSQTLISLGSSGSSSTTAGLVGINTSVNDSRAQYLVRASEITAAGGHVGNIVSLALYLTEEPGRDLEGLTIKLKNTTVTSLTTTFQTSGTTVYQRTKEWGRVLASGGWRTFFFDTPFCWEGTNLLVEICFDNSTATAGGGVQVYSPSSSERSSTYLTSNASSVSGCSLSATATRSYSRPYFQFSIIPVKPVSVTVNKPTCGAVTSGATNTISFSSVVNPSCLPTSVGAVRYSIDDGSTWQASSSFTNVSPGIYSYALKYLNSPNESKYMLKGSFSITVMPTVSGPSVMCVGSTDDLIGFGELIPTNLPTGGSVTLNSLTNRRIHVFTESGTFINSTSEKLVGAQVLVLAGGGGGGERHAGGGGAGGLIYEEEVVITTGSHAVVVGKGGVGGGKGIVTGFAGDGGAFSGINIGGKGANGENSTFETGTITYTAIGGGGGGANENGTGNIGGSGGGGSNANSGAIGIYGQGNRGGSHYSNHASGCGGGGAGGAANNSPTPIAGTSGGDGRYISITGASVAYAGGGGGGTNLATGGFSGGIGGGGTGGGKGTAVNNNNTVAGGNSTENASRMGGNGQVNTGGGGGGGGAFDTGNGAGNSGKGGNGGSGVVIISYQMPSYTSSNSSIVSVDFVTGAVTANGPGNALISFTTPAGCVVEHSILVKAPQGNPAVFGTNQWNVYGYNGNNTTLSANSYKGNYTQPAITSDYGVNTQLYWSINNSPSYAGSTIDNENLWAGCAVTVDNHTIVHKRKGFPCGTYNINPLEWDDRTEIYLNGTSIWSCNGWYGSGTCPITSAGNFKLDANSELEIRTFESSGGAVDKIEIKPVFTGIAGTANRECPVSGNQYIDFLDGNGNLIASINPQNNMNGVMKIESYAGSPNYMDACNEPGNLLYRTAYMGRSWVFRLQSGSITGNVSVRLPFTNSELSDLVTASTVSLSPANPYDNVLNASSLIATKFSSSVEDNDPHNNCTSGTSTVLNQVGSPGDLSAAPYNMASVKYVVFNVSSFSEFYLHGGSAINSPLPIELVNFVGECSNSGIKLRWQTASETNNAYFLVQRTRAFDSWETIGNVIGAGNSSQLLSYEFEDDNGYNGMYYRLVQVDFNGDAYEKSPIYMNCLSSSSSFVVYPNPTDSKFTVEINTDESMKDVDITLFDITGKTIENRNVSIVAGVNAFLFDAHASQGTYFIQVKLKDKHTEIKKLIINY